MRRVGEAGAVAVDGGEEEREALVQAGEAPTKISARPIGRLTCLVSSAAWASARPTSIFTAVYAAGMVEWDVLTARPTACWTLDSGWVLGAPASASTSARRTTLIPSS